MLAAGPAPRGHHIWEQQPRVHGSRADVCVPSPCIPAWGPMANPGARILKSRRETASVQLQKEYTWLLLLFFFWERGRAVTFLAVTSWKTAEARLGPPRGVLPAPAV